MPSRSRMPCRSGQRGITLMELMVVIVIMGTILLLVPVNLTGFGAQSRLSNAGDNLVAALNGAREKAINEAYEVTLQLGWFEGEDGEDVQGWRFKFTSNPPGRLIVDEHSEEFEEQQDQRREEREWLYSSWRQVPDGVEISGLSQEEGSWSALLDNGKPYEIRFFADGTVDHGVAVRFESVDLAEEDVKPEHRTITVIVNPLTSDPRRFEGLEELPQTRPAAEFGNG